MDKNKRFQFRVNRIKANSKLTSEKRKEFIFHLGIDSRDFVFFFFFNKTVALFGENKNYLILDELNIFFFF